MQPDSIYNSLSLTMRQVDTNIETRANTLSRYDMRILPPAFVPFVRQLSHFGDFQLLTPLRGDAQ